MGLESCLQRLDCCGLLFRVPKIGGCVSLRVPSLGYEIVVVVQTEEPAQIFVAFRFRTLDQVVSSLLIEIYTSLEFWMRQSYAVGRKDL